MVPIPSIWVEPGTLWVGTGTKDSPCHLPLRGKRGLGDRHSCVFEYVNFHYFCSIICIYINKMDTHSADENRTRNRQQMILLAHWGLSIFLFLCCQYIYQYMQCGTLYWSSTQSCFQVDLLQVSLLINKQTGGKKKKKMEGKGGGEWDLWTTCSENETGQDLAKHAVFLLAQYTYVFIRRCLYEIQLSDHQKIKKLQYWENITEGKKLFILTKEILNICLLYFTCFLYYITCKVLE